ncbi:hypothetical protein ACXAXP_000874 [Escherichia coli]
MLDALTFDAGSTLTPDYMLMLDSRDITGNISDRLMSMTLTDSGVLHQPGYRSCRYLHGNAGQSVRL